MTPFSDSIVALSSGRLPAGVAVVRLSGQHARLALETIIGFVPPPRTAVFSKVQGSDGELIDSGLALYFPGPHSFTGEDVAEFQVHGGRAVVSALLKAICTLPGFRLADAGEFSHRAFLNGKIDLLGAEALADLIDAETEAQRRFALFNAEGGHGRLYATWRDRLISLRAMLEANIDFSDEDDVPSTVLDNLFSDIERLRDEIDAHLASYHKTEIVRDGYDVVILGAPNVGKSSLLNALARRDVAIVTDEPGTTRDLLEVTLDVKGVKIRLTDTAGLRNEAGHVEAIGIERALDKARKADLIVRLIDSTTSPMPFFLPEADAPVVEVRSKSDLDHNPSNGLAISTVTGQGLDELLDELRARAQVAVNAYDNLVPWTERHVQLLTACRNILETARAGNPVELLAEDLRHAGDRIGQISGAVGTEDLLDVIFSRFCIGK